MSPNPNTQLVFTVKDRCRVCYTCVRECPVKAIKIINGQAEVISTRCIGCGNCIRVCSQNAKVYLDTTAQVFEYLKSGEPIVACIAPSFAADFTDITDYKILVGMLKKLGFTYVLEVAFGADLVAREYRKLLDNPELRHSISSDCPAIVYYIRHYHPNLISSIAPVVSPMVATARVARRKFGQDVKVVFIGPCIAKKAENTELDQAITFSELRNMFDAAGITPEETHVSDFDEPKGGKAAIFPITRGKLNSVNVTDTISDENIIVASGRVHFREAIKEFEEGLNASHHLELLCCEGCIMGPGMSCSGKIYSKTTHIRDYVRKKIEDMDLAVWERSMQDYADIDLGISFKPADRRLPLPTEEEISQVLVSIGKIKPQDHLNCGACGYDTCREHAIAIIEGLAESEMCLPYTIEKLHMSIQELNLSNEKLASAQLSLRQSEKLATMGQLSAGIAHELNNPLGIITMYSNILMEEARPDNPVRKDLELIVEQADRCKKIVGGLLNFARKNQVHLSETDINEFTRHSIESLIVPDNIQIAVQSNLSEPYAYIDNDQWMQVMVNIEKNAIEAMPGGGKLEIILNEVNGDIEFTFKDNGLGITQENMDKIFTPFFTTKPIGKGTGLGLPLIYGIVKMHCGQIHIESNAEADKGPTGTSFKIRIPKKNIKNTVL